MCKLDDIIKTTPQGIVAKESQAKGISINRIEFNTDIVFALAKKIERPLDETLALIKESKANTCLSAAFGKRKKMSQREIVDNLHNHIVALQ